MYDELIKRLRHPWGYNGLISELTNSAADAIESVSKAYQMMAEAYESEVMKSQWIPVTEQLPKEDGEYLVVFKLCGFIDGFKINEEEIKILRYHDRKWFPGCIPKWLNDTLKQEVTCWMPLPELPKEETK